MRVAEHTWALVPRLLAWLLVAEVAGAREGEGGCGLVGLRSTLGESVALGGEVALAPACGAGGGVALRAGLDGSWLALEHSWLGGHRTRVAVDGRLQLAALPPLGVGLLAEEERLGRGLPGRLHLTQRLTLATRAFHLTHHLYWMVRWPPGEPACSLPRPAMVRPPRPVTYGSCTGWGEELSFAPSSRTRWARGSSPTSSVWSWTRAVARGWRSTWGSSTGPSSLPARTACGSPGGPTRPPGGRRWWPVPGAAGWRWP